MVRVEVQGFEGLVVEGMQQLLRRKQVSLSHLKAAVTLITPAWQCGRAACKLRAPASSQCLMRGPPPPPTPKPPK